jgi:hypothetical protein
MTDVASICQSRTVNLVLTFSNLYSHLGPGTLPESSLFGHMPDPEVVVPRCGTLALFRYRQLRADISGWC